ncbi:hypothetical protein PSTG_02283 [Puccinia striiformis f. sp. tritici PST-78]|uniref:Uncharacterized protein n=1 Tax=Puccinia striiformis f. sp. tritici PST-78 TaxID=1165861 RepID=A0A0L0VYM6_9BASI|nr:hypothetical protein PSTG_02283 [Puccinia striiformis f. sp. tritici PST-78]
MLFVFRNRPVHPDEGYLANLADATPWARIEHNLNHFQQPAKSSNKWIVFPRHGDILADAFQRPVVHISDIMLVTFLPSNHAPTTNPPLFLIYIEEAEGWPDVIQLNRDKWNRRFPQLTEATHLDIASSDNEDKLAA